MSREAGHKACQMREGGISSMVSQVGQLTSVELDGDKNLGREGSKVEVGAPAPPACTSSVPVLVFFSACFSGKGGRRWTCLPGHVNRTTGRGHLRAGTYRNISLRTPCNSNSERTVLWPTQRKGGVLWHLIRRSKRNEHPFLSPTMTHVHCDS